MSTEKIESKITISKNGRFLIHRTIITHIYPSDYYRAVLANAIKLDETELSDEDIAKMVKIDRAEKDRQQKLGDKNGR